MSKYQLLPPLSPDEYASLFDDIASGGVKVPIDVDEAGEILDGHHRKRVCDELGIECPTRVVEIPEAAKADYALTVNLARRHLDRMQRRQLVVNSLKLDYRLGDRVHARRCGVDHKTVTSIRADLVAVGEIPHLTEREGADGKTYPASKPTPPSAPAATPGRAEAPEIPPDDESGEDRPATGTLGEAEDASHVPATDVTTPSETPTDSGSSPEESELVDEPEQAALGVTPPAPAPKPVETDEEKAEREDREFRTDRTLEFCRALVDLTMRLGKDPVAWFEQVYLPGVYEQRDLPQVKDCFEPESLHRLAVMLDALGEHLTQTGKSL